MNVKNKQASNKKKWIIAGLVLLILATGALIYANTRPDATAPQEETDSGFSPATEEEKQDSEDHKEVLTKDQAANASNSSNDSASKKSVSPVITSYDQDESVNVYSYVPGVVENGGTCTLKLTKGSQTVSASAKGVENVSSTSCGMISIAQSKLQSGTWSATISYKSSSATGVSKALSIEVQ